MPEDNRADLRWHKSSRSGGDNCVLVAVTNGRVYVRDSKDLDGPILSFAGSAWDGFLDDVRAGGFDRPAE